MNMGVVLEVSAKAPGKILWIGGYSVLERPNISFVNAVDAYVTATATDRHDASVKLDAPQLGISFSAKIDGERFRGNVPEELVLMKTAAEIAFRYAVEMGAKPSGLDITTNSDSPFAYSTSGGKVVKSGLGSSAAVTVATVGSVLKLFEIDGNINDAVHKLSQAAHSIATGKVGSGFDIAAAVYGTILYTRYSPSILNTFPKDYTGMDLAGLVKRDWDYSIRKFAMPRELKLVFANFGDSMITTKALGSVSEFKIKDPRTYSKLMKEIDSANRDAVNALERMKNGENGDEDAFRESFDIGRAATKKLGALSGVGIEPDDCTQLIEDSKKNGAFVAKLPGAGGRDAVAALCRSDSERLRLREYWNGRKELRVLELNSVEGGMN